METEQPLQKPKQATASTADFFWEMLKIVIIAIVIIIPVRFFVIQPFFVKGNSMEPNFANGEYLIINEIGYRLSNPDRGDVIVFKYPRNPSEYFIKRIVGLPGEKVLINDGKITITKDDFMEPVILDEKDYLPGDTETRGQLELTLGEDEYAVLGDNRNASSDSRMWGALPGDNIVGEAWLKLWPLKDISVVSSQ